MSDDAVSNASSRRSRASGVGGGVDNSSKQLNFPVPLTTKILSKYFPLFPTMLSFKSPNPHVISLLGMVIYAAQHWAYVINPHFKYQWGYILGKDITNILYGLYAPLYDRTLVHGTSVNVLLAMIYLLLGLVLLMYSCIFLHFRIKEDNAEAKGIPALISRVLLEGISTIFLIPTLQLCFSCMVCGSEGYIWVMRYNSDAVCWDTFHLAAFIPASICLLLLLPVLYIKISCMYLEYPSPVRKLAKRHTILDQASFFNDILSSVLFCILLGWSTPLAFSVILALQSALMIALYMYFLPFYVMLYNRVFVFIHSIECLAAIYLSCSLGNQLFFSADIASVLLIGSGSVAALLAISVTDIRVKSEFTNEINRALRHHVSDASDSDSSGDSAEFLNYNRDEREDSLPKFNMQSLDSLPYPKGLATTSQFSIYTDVEKQVFESYHHQDYNVIDGTEGKNEALTKEVIQPYISHVRVNTDVHLAASFIDIYSLYFGSTQISSTMILFASKIYSKGLISFPDDATVMQSFAGFLVRYVPGLSFMGVGVVKQLLQLPNCSLQHQFRALKQANQLRLSLGIRTHVHSMKSARARLTHGKVLALMNNFWVKLTEPSVNIKEVSAIADRIRDQRQLAIVQFEGALRNQVNADPLLIKRLGDFFSEVMIAPDAAQECYSESRDIYEARQARSMRGTKHTTEVDAASLSERLIHLLRYHGSGSGYSGKAASSLVKRLTIAVTILYLILATCCSLLIFVATEINSNTKELSEGASAAAFLRYASSRISSDVIGFNIVLNSTIGNDISNGVAAITPQFLDNFRYISSGNGRPKSPEGIFLLTRNTIPYFSKSVNNQNAYSLWSFAETFLQAVSGYIDNLGKVSLAQSQNLNSEFIATLGMALGGSFNTFLSIYSTNEVSLIANKWLAWAVVLFIFSSLFLVVVYVVFAFGIHRTALSRVFTFQLFTLIPYDTLEKLATETKEKYMQITYKKGFGVATKSLGPNDIPEKVTEKRTEEVRMDRAEAQVKDTIKVLSIATAVPLKSCLKVTDERKPKKQVKFNPVVEVVGGKDAAGGKRDSPKQAQTDDDDFNILLLEQMNRRKTSKAAAKSAQKEQENVVWATIFVYFITFAIIVASTILLGFTFRSENQIHKEFTTFDQNKENLSQVATTLPLLIFEMLRFFKTGNVLYFQSSEAHISSLYNTIPKFIGSAFSDEDSASLLRLHELVQRLGNLSLDLGLLAAKRYNISLSFFSDAREYDSVSMEDWMRYTTKRYADAALIATQISTDVSADFPLTFACTALTTLGIPISQEFRAQFIEIVHNLHISTKLHDILVSSSLIAICVMYGALTAFCFMVAFTPLRKFFSKYVARLDIFIMGMASAILLSLTLTLIITGSRSVEGFERYDAAVTSCLQMIDLFSRTDEQFVHFLFSAEPAAWFGAIDVDPYTVTDNLAQTISKEYLSESYVNSFNSDVVEEWKRIRVIQRIGSTLGIKSLSSLMYVEKPMLDALATAQWNIADENDALTNYLRWPPEGLYYTNATYDLNTRTKVEQYQIAINLALGPEHFQRFSTTNSALSTFFRSFVKGGNTSLSNTFNWRDNVLVACLALSVLPLAAWIWLSSRLLSTFRGVLGLVGTSQGNLTYDSSRYESMLARTRYTLALIAVFLCATFAMLIWFTQIGSAYVQQLITTTGRGFDASLALYFFRLFLSPWITYPSPSEVLQSSADLALHISAMFEGNDVRGVPNGVKLSQEFNRICFGSDDLQRAMEITTSYYMNNCSQFKSGLDSPIIPATKEDYAGFSIPIVEALEMWLTYLRRAAYISDIAGFFDWTPLISLHEDISALEVPLLDALTITNNIFADALDAHRQKVYMICLFLAIASLLVTVVVYFGIALPTVLQLFSEEDAARMLLQMIPGEVRDQVPAISQYIETGQITNAAELQKAFEASEKLLQNILPQKIAARLKKGEQPIADKHPCVTMLFTDFVGFTKRSSTMQAREIVDFLNEVFLEFDTVVELLGVEKIKTIGDAFFMAGGLDPKVVDHALRVVEAGLMFFEALIEHNSRHPSRVPLQMRLGIHSGPVIAGVIGTKKVAYDLWGDSVEIANAMESTGVPGYVHISETTADFVRGFFELKSRGDLPREKEHIPDNMPPTYLVMGRLLPTPYMHLRRPKLIPTKFREKNDS